MNEDATRTLGRSSACDLTLEHASVSRLHATVRATPEGFLSLRDAGSRNGLFLHRNERWIRVQRVILGSQDRVRLGEQEVPLERLVALFGERTRVRLRESYSVRGRPLLLEPSADVPRPRTVLEHPRRNPLTGDIEEVR